MASKFPPKAIESWAKEARIGELLESTRHAHALRGVVEKGTEAHANLGEILDACFDEINYRCYRKAEKAGKDES